jgi:hypothetical protein
MQPGAHRARGASWPGGFPEPTVPQHFIRLESSEAAVRGKTAAFLAHSYPEKHTSNGAPERRSRRRSWRRHRSHVLPEPCTLNNRRNNASNDRHSRRPTHKRNDTKRCGVQLQSGPRPSTFFLVHQKKIKILTRVYSDGQEIESLIWLSENSFIPRLSSKVGHWKSPSCFQEAAEIVGCS